MTHISRDTLRSFHLCPLSSRRAFAEIPRRPLDLAVRPQRQAVVIVRTPSIIRRESGVVGDVSAGASFGRRFDLAESARQDAVDPFESHQLCVVNDQSLLDPAMPVCEPLR
jgi:hypothetical protein